MKVRLTPKGRRITEMMLYVEQLRPVHKCSDYMDTMKVGLTEQGYIELRCIHCQTTIEFQWRQVQPVEN
jgi:hypothetical protein